MKKLFTTCCLVLLGIMAQAQWKIPMTNGDMETSSSLTEDLVSSGNVNFYTFDGGRFVVVKNFASRYDGANSGFTAAEGIDASQAIALSISPNVSGSGAHVRFETDMIDVSSFGTGKYTFSVFVKAVNAPVASPYPVFITFVEFDEGMNFTATDLATQEVSRVRPDATSLTSYQEFKLTLDILETTRFVRLQIQAANQSNIYYFDNFSLSADDVVVWEGSAWSNNGAGPTATDIVVINDVLNVNSDLAVKDIMVKSGTLTLQSGSSLNIAGTATGSATVMRNTTGNSGYSIVGAPVSGANLSALSADYLYTWNGSSWITPTESMISGMGYFAGYDAATPTVTLTGTLVSGDQTAAVTTAGDGFNLVANPYAAAISITNFLSESSNSTIDGSVYFWNDGGTNNGSLRGGDYVTVNAAGNVSNIVLADGQNGQNTSASNTHIGSMQGFFVHATSDGNLTFKPTMQTSTAGTNADANYYRQTSENQAKLKLSLSGDHYSEVLFAFRADGTLGWDRHLDALHKTSNETFAFYSLLGEKRFSIQGLPELLDTEIIKLGYDLETAGEYVLSINKFENISDSYRVVANYQGESFDITGNDAVLNLTAGRGEIELTITNTRVLSAEIQSELSVYNREGLLKIQMNESLDKASIHIIDIQGRSHFYAKDEQLVKGQWSKNVNLHSGQLYVLRITSKNGVLTKKFIY